MAMGREKRSKRLVGNRGNEMGFEGLLGLGLGFVEEEGKRRWGISGLAVGDAMGMAVDFGGKTSALFSYFQYRLPSPLRYRFRIKFLNISIFSNSSWH